MIEPDSLILGDCLDVMQEIPDGSVDMVLCDLPYGCTINKWDTTIPFEPLWAEYNRIRKKNTAIVLFGQGLFSHRLAISNEKLFRYNMVYEKSNAGNFLNVKRMPLLAHEDILVFYQHLPTYNPQMSKGSEIVMKHKRGNRSSTNFGNIVSDYPYESHGLRYPRTVIKFSNSGHRGGKFAHPTAKPVALCEYLIKTYTNEGDTVLDNCMGSGTTCLAALNTNRHYIGIEKDETYFNIAKERIEKAKSDHIAEVSKMV